MTFISEAANPHEKPSTRGTNAEQGHKNLINEVVGEMDKRLPGKYHSFDEETGRHAYLTGNRTGRWIDLKGNTGKVNFNSAGGVAYYSASGKHEYTIRADGSRLNMKDRTIISKEKDGGVKIKNVDNDVAVIKNKDGHITSAGRSKYNRMEYTYADRKSEEVKGKAKNTKEAKKSKELTEAHMVVDGKRGRTPVWQRSNDPDEISTASVQNDGKLHITSLSGQKVVYDGQLKKSQYGLEPGKLPEVTLANGSPQLHQADRIPAGQAGKAQELTRAKAEYTKVFEEKVRPALLADKSLRLINGVPIEKMPVEELGRRYALALADGKDPVQALAHEKPAYYKKVAPHTSDRIGCYRAAKSAIERSIDTGISIARRELPQVEDDTIEEEPPLPKL